MYRLLFQNRNMALLFAAIMIVSAVGMVGTKEEAGTLTDMERQIAGQRESFDQTVGAMDEAPEEAEEADEAGFATDEDLIDEATGEEPSADEEEADAPSSEPAVELVDVQDESDSFEE